MPPTETREIPLRDLVRWAGDKTGTCHGCGRGIVWAITVAGPNGRGGKAMPLDPAEDLAGNVAVTVVTVGRLAARVLMKDESADRPLEFLAQTHFATCPVGAHPVMPVPVLNRATKPRRRRGARR